MEIVATEKTGTLRAYLAAANYGATVEQIQDLKNGATVTVPTEAATLLIADGYAKEA